MSANVVWMLVHIGQIKSEPDIVGVVERPTAIFETLDECISIVLWPT